MVGQGNQIEDVRFLFSPFSPLATPPLWPPKREDNPVSAEVDEFWQYRTSGNLTIFDKDHDTAGSRRFLQPSIRLRYNYKGVPRTGRTPPLSVSVRNTEYLQLKILSHPTKEISTLFCMQNSSSYPCILILSVMPALVCANRGHHPPQH